MNNFDKLLMANALGALEPGDSLALRERLTTDVALAFRAGGLVTLVGTRPSFSYFARRSYGTVDTPVLASGDPFQLGKRVVLRIVPPISADSARCVLFRETLQGRKLLHPLGSSWPTLDRFRSDGNLRLLDVVLEAPTGDHLYDLVLVPSDLFTEAWPLEDRRWEGVLDTFRNGGLPGLSYHVTVGS